MNSRKPPKTRTKHWMNVTRKLINYRLFNAQKGHRNTKSQNVKCSPEMSEAFAAENIFNQ